MKQYFADWARTKDIIVLDGSGRKKKMMPKKFASELGEAGDELYIESGFSARLTFSLIQRGLIVFRADAGKVNTFREELGFPRVDKSDDNDPELIYQVFEHYPDVFIKVPEPTADEVMLRGLFLRYKQITRTIVRNKLSNIGFEWETGGELEGIEESNTALEKTKKTILKKMVPLIKDDLKKFKEHTNIRGVGPALFAQLISAAHPKDFDSLAAYLSYVGCKGHSFWNEIDNDGQGHGRGKFNRNAKEALYLMADIAIRHKAKQPEFINEWYDSIKQRFLDEELPRWKAHRKAMNRLETKIAKEIYLALRKDA